VRTRIVRWLKVPAALAAVATCGAGFCVPPAAAATTFTVTNTSNSATTVGSFPWALAQVNGAGSSGDTIAFDIPGTGPFVIAAASPTTLPVSSAQTTIDGCTQPGASCSGGPPFGLQIELSGYTLRAYSDGDTFRGLSITGSTGAAIDTFRFALNGQFHSATDLTIEDDYLGVRPDGSAAGNVYGIDTEAQSGGASFGLVGWQILDNVISANSSYGILQPAYVFANTHTLPLTQSTIAGNVIGLDPTGTQPRPNGNGVLIDLSGDLRITDNTIADNTGFGIEHLGANQAPPGSPIAQDPGTLIQGNTIRGNGATGLLLGPTTGHTPDPYSGPVSIFGNTIAGNGVAGLSLADAADTIRPNILVGGIGGGQPNAIYGNNGPGLAVGANASDTTVSATIRGNSIYGNTGPRIDLADDGATPNAPPGITPVGPNLFLNYPVISSITHDPLVVQGTYAGPSNSTVTLDFYSSPTSGGPQTWLGFQTVTTDFTGDASFSFSPGSDVPAGSFVSATATDANGDTSEFGADTAVPAAADLSLSQSASPTPAVPGRDETFTLTVANHGPDAATDVTVTDPLPAGLSFVSGSSGCSASTSTVTCTSGSLASGSSEQFTFSTRLASSLQVGLVNVATVSSHTDDPDPGNNAATASAALGPQADLELAAAASTASVSAGGQVTFTLTVGNAGPSDARDVALDDELPAGVTVASVTPSQGTCTTGGGVVCQLGTIAAGGSAQVLVTVNVASTASGALVDTASVVSGQPDPDPHNNTAETSVNADPLLAPRPRAHLEIVEQAKPKTAYRGQKIDYTIVVSNTGPGVADGVTVLDTPSLGLKILHVKEEQGSCRAVASRLKCSIGSVGSGDAVRITIQAEVGRSGTEANKASVTTASYNTNAAGDVASAETKIRSQLLRLRDAASPSTARSGHGVSYTIKVTNPTAAPIAGVVVCAALPAGLIQTGDRPLAHLSDGRYCWNIAQLRGERSASFTLDANVAALGSGRKLSWATAVAPGVRRVTATAVIRVLGFKPAPCPLASAARTLAKHPSTHAGPIGRAAC
jgi:uncharacterized repeat protein (TIGR01451 family)